MMITKQTVADQIAAYLHHGITQAKLVDWSENALMGGEFDEKDAAAISAVVSQAGVLSATTMNAGKATTATSETGKSRIAFPAWKP